MEKLLAIHWAGWMNPSEMEKNLLWFRYWKLRARASLKNGNELVIIEIPKNTEALEAIERLLQEKFPLNANQ